ncbi:MAG: Crp/Fnr family transcriptional regulator [Bacteroidota bacterium]
MSQTFRQLLKQLIDVPDETIDVFEGYGVKKSAHKNEMVFAADSAPFSKLFFLEKGLLRAYRIIDGEDISFYFFTPGEFAVDYESYLRESTSQLFFEAVLDSAYLEFDKADINFLYQEYPKFERVGRLMAEKAYLSATERVKQFQAAPLGARYQKLLERAPELFQQVPQYHIASYLGVKPQSLSRLRAKLLGKIY